ncbi:N-6 DNA methylase [Candidatus Poriferisodalis sp.]|uniref:N-6 DNA methylase n=1 Tax=Candidatus Poriferisodalis sp. TaxID=3101277 RepID=UPI003B5B34FB
MALTLPEAVLDDGPTGGIVDEQQLCAIAWALAGAGHLKDVSRAEQRLIARTSQSPAQAVIEQVASAIRQGEDPLGTAFASLRPAAQRRKLGATYTPASLIGPMSEWLANHKRASRVVDPGAGSARFLVAAGRLLPEARLVAVEIDPLASLAARANLTVLGFDERSEMHTADYRTLALEPGPGPTAFIGNPPYVRHHDIAPEWKAWLRERSAELGLKASALAGLHVHFLLATAHHARAGDYGVFVTSSEWLDVGYGQLARDLMAGPLGGLSIHVLDARSQAFADAATTAAVTAFEVGDSQRGVRVRKIKRMEDLRCLQGGRRFSRERLRTARRWSSLLEPKVSVPREFVPLGEFCRVHRGAVTGANSTWVTQQDDPRLPTSVLFPAVTRASELINLGSDALRDDGHLRAVIDLPEDLDVLDADGRELVKQFLSSARQAGAASGYIARHRKPWWSVKLRDPAPILATYMARRPPTFVRNLIAARNINAVHGIYPIDFLSDEALSRLTKSLGERATVAGGRTYAGGLTKFEPSEMEQIMVPPPNWLESSEALASLA